MCDGNILFEWCSKRLLLNRLYLKGITNTNRYKTNTKNSSNSQALIELYIKSQ